jgi:hypothetical protein
MSGNGQVVADDAQVLCWPRPVLSADDLRRHLAGQRELLVLPRAIITPLAADELRARGIRVRRQEPKPEQAETGGTSRWGYALERPDAAVDAAVQALTRDGTTIDPLAPPAASLWEWAGAVTAAVAQGRWLGGVVFCGDPGLVCCIANKVSGMRAVAVATPQAAARACKVLGANLLAVEVPGRTFFELRQILRTVCGNGPACCPEGLAKALKELDGHAHR